MPPENACIDLSVVNGHFNFVRSGPIHDIVQMDLALLNHNWPRMVEDEETA